VGGYFLTHTLEGRRSV